MTYNVNDFIGGNIGSFMVHTEESLATTTIRVDKAVKEKGFFGSVVDTVKGWFSPSTSQAPKVEVPKLDLIQAIQMPMESSLWDLHEDCLVQIISRIDILELHNVAPVSQQANRIVQVVLYHRAQIWGYEGGSIDAGRLYFCEVIEELKTLRLGVVYQSNSDQLKHNLSMVNNLDKEIYLLSSIKGCLHLKSAPSKTRNFILKTAYVAFSKENLQAREMFLGGDQGAILLLSACAHKAKDIALFALKSGIDPHEALALNLFSSYTPKNALQCAVQCYNSQDYYEATDEEIAPIVELLLEYGANPDQFAGNDLPALAHAAWNQSDHIYMGKTISVLLKYGADVNLTGATYPHTPLQWVCMAGKTEGGYTVGDLQVMFQLTKHGADWFTPIPGPLTRQCFK